MINSLENKLLDWQTASSPQGLVYPVAREGQTSGYCPDLEGIVMFGGLSCARLNDFYLFDILEKKWSEPVTKGKTPLCRSYHMSFIDEGRFFVYGGQGEKGKSLGDLHVLVLNTMIWKRLFVMEAPPARHQAAMSISYDAEERTDHQMVQSPFKELDSGNNTQRMRSPIKEGQPQFVSENQYQSFKSKTAQVLKKEKTIVGFSNNPESDSWRQRKEKRVFLFGGISMPSQTLFNDLWELNASAVDFGNTMEELPGAFWTELHPKGKVD